MKRKVFGGLTIGEGGQLRTVIAATSKREAARILGISLYEFNAWWGETGNKEEIEAAMSEPGSVFCKPLDGDGPYKKLV